jgi:competence protein ComEC
MEKFYVYEPNNSAETFDIYTIHGNVKTLDIPNFESQFDFENYLNDKGVARQLFVNSRDIKFEIFIRKKIIKENFLSSFNDETASYLDSLLFNVKDYDSNLISAANNLNLVYLLSVSGIYLSLIMRGMEYLLKVKLSERRAKIITLSILSFYLFFAIEKIGVMRLVLIYIMKIINDVALKKKFSHLQIVSLSGIAILLIDYHFAYSMGFYIGYGVSIVLVFSNCVFKTKKRWLRSVLTSILVFIFILPISIALGNEMHILGLLYQFILIPINLVGMVISIISFYICPFSAVINGYVSILSNLLFFLKKIDVAIYLGQISIYSSCLFYALYFLGLYSLEISYRKGFKLSLSMILIIFVLSALPIDNHLSESVYFINVGQGDSALITRGSHSVLIDTGGNLKVDLAQETLIPFFKKKRIYHLDAVFISHHDYDHSGALPSLFKNFPIRNIYDFDSKYPVVAAGIRFQNLNSLTHADENDNSAVLRFSFMSKQWLFTGDISSLVERELIEHYDDLNINYLKVSHHGSDTATSLAFLNKTTPEEAIISVGENNRYGHPSLEIVARLQKMGIKIRRTDKEGTVSYHRFAFNV